LVRSRAKNIFEKVACRSSTHQSKRIRKLGSMGDKESTTPGGGPAGEGAQTERGVMRETLRELLFEIPVFHT